MTDTMTAPIAAPGTASPGHNLPTGEEVLTMVSRDPSLPLTDKALREQLFAELQREIDALEADTSTEVGRKKISKLAGRLASYRTAIDNAGKDMTEVFRKQTNAVNAERNAVKAALQDMQGVVTAPLDRWKAAESERQDKITRIMDSMASAAQGIHALPSAAIQQRIDTIAALTFDKELFVEGTMAAEDAQQDALSALRDALAVATAREAQEAELAELREAAARREREDAESRAEAQRKRDADAAAERIAAQAKADAQAAVEREQAAAANEAQRQIDEANERARQAEQQRLDEIDRQEAQRVADEAERQRIAAEQAEREADQAHRADVLAKAGAAIEALGVKAPVAEKIMLAIAAGNVPNVSVRF